MKAIRGTQAELAERLGVSVKRVTNAIERGVIRASRVGTNARGHRCIVNMDKAEADFRAAEVRGLRSDVREVPERNELPDLPDLPDDIDPMEVGDGLMPPAGVDLQTARTIREWWGALRERSKHEREQGAWVKREDVRRDAYVVARSARDAILRVPDRVADDLAAEPDGARVRERLRSELTRTLEDLANALEKGA